MYMNITELTTNIIYVHVSCLTTVFVLTSINEDEREA